MKTIHLPDELHAKLKALAEKNHRPITMQIQALLEEVSQ